MTEQWPYNDNTREANWHSSPLQREASPVTWQEGQAEKFGDRVTSVCRTYLGKDIDKCSTAAKKFMNVLGHTCHPLIVNRTLANNTQVFIYSRQPQFWDGSSKVFLQHEAIEYQKGVKNQLSYPTQKTNKQKQNKTKQKKMIEKLSTLILPCQKVK